jgi:transposase
VAALDIGKAQLTCCVRVPSPAARGKRLQEVRTYPTMTRSLLMLADRLTQLGVTRVVMEATSDYWKPPFYLLEAQGFEVWLVNARDVKHLPGRPKTDKLDAVWLCKVAERQMLRPSFVPPPAIRRLRDPGPLPRRPGRGPDGGEAAGGAGCSRTPRSSCRWSPRTSSGSPAGRCSPALVAGERDPKALAQLARRRLRAKTALLEEAFYGHFTDHHAFLLQTMLGRVDQASAAIAAVEAQIEAAIAPFAQAVDRLDEITGVGRAAAQVIIAEIGVDMGRFPTAGHLVSWARYAPGVKESAGKRKGNHTTGHGNPYLARVLGEAAVAAGRTNTFLGERYRRIARRRGAKRAIVAVGRSILVIIWHLLADPDARYCDLGAGFYQTRIDTERRKRNHVRQLEALGYKVTLQPAA